ncbi:MAG: DUF5011 domain-containing protein, partial [Nitrosopumilus sp.]|nr:DUF5011 domain-containing protein [Nitrosopumilus sp.]
YDIVYDCEDEAGNRASEDLFAARARVLTVAEPPRVNINGANPVRIFENATYVELGATCTGTAVQDGTAATITGRPDITVGTYNVTYTCTDTLDISSSKNRTVHVIDNTPPVITRDTGSIYYHEINSPIREPGATCTDAGMELEIQRTGGPVAWDTRGDYPLVFSCTDAAGLSASAGVEVRVREAIPADDAPPVVTVVPPTTRVHEPGVPYRDPGATCRDAQSGDIDVIEKRVSTLRDGRLVSFGVLGGSVDPDTEGSYSVSYDCTDQAGNRASEDAAAPRQRDVHVVAPPSISIIGERVVEAPLNSDYEDMGATCTTIGGISRAEAEIPVDTRLPGNYTVTYTCEDAFMQRATDTRTVIVVVNDLSPPRLIIPRAVITTDVNVPVELPEVRCVDTEDPAPRVVPVGLPIDFTVPGRTVVTYTCTDRGLNTDTGTVTVVVSDSGNPSVTLIGNSSVTLLRNEAYFELGANCVDDTDPPRLITPSGGGPVNVLIPDTYELEYSCQDTSGNPSNIVTRTVEVIDSPVILVGGPERAVHQAGTLYSDLGAACLDPITGSVTAARVTGEAAVSEPGKYEITFRCTDDRGSVRFATRSVEVFELLPPDVTPPVLTLPAPAAVDVYGRYVEPVATCTDAVGGDLDVEVGTHRVSVISPAGTSLQTIFPSPRTVVDTSPSYTGIFPGFDGSTSNVEYRLSFSCTDQAGNQVSRVGHGPSASTRTGAIPAAGEFTVRGGFTTAPADTQPPFPVVHGPEAAYHPVGAPYTDPGAKCTDGHDGIFDPVVGGTVDHERAGSYLVTYSCTDRAGNGPAVGHRLVRVVDTAAPALHLAGDEMVRVELG